MKRNVRARFGAAIGIAMAFGTPGPALADAYYASSQLCYGADCSEMGYAEPLASLSHAFHRDVPAEPPSPVGYFDESSSASATARQVTFEVGFLGGSLPSSVFLASTPQRPPGSLTLIAFMGAIAEDELTITAPGLASGFVSIEASLHAGGINGCTAVGGCASGLPFVSPHLDLQFFTQANGKSGSSQLLDVAQLTAIGGFAQLYTSPQISFVAGTPFSVRLGISGTMNLRELFDSPSPPDVFVSGGTLGATATIEKLHVFHANGQPVADATIVATSGTNWTTTVPEPSDGASAVTAALALATMRRPFRRRASR